MRNKVRSNQRTYTGDMENVLAINKLSLLVPGIFFVHSLIVLSSYPNLTPIALTHAVILAVLGCIFVLLHYFTKARYSANKVLFLYLTLALIIFFYSSVMRLQSGLSLYFFPLILSLQAVYSKPKQWPYRSVIVIWTLLLFLLGSQIDLHPYLAMIKGEILENRTRLATFVQNLILIGTTIYIAFENNEKHRKLFSKAIEEENTINKLKLEAVERQNETKDRLLQAALQGDSQLIILFKLVYPEFFINLLKENPELSNELFRLCVYIKLGFSTKDIAEFNHRTLRSIQTRKNRLRKSFNLKPDMDLYEWIKRY